MAGVNVGKLGTQVLGLGLSAGEKLLLLYGLLVAGQKKIELSEKEWGEAVRVNVRTVRRGLSTLREAGYLILIESPHYEYVKDAKTGERYNALVPTAYRVDVKAIERSYGK